MEVFHKGRWYDGHLTAYLLELDVSDDGSGSGEGVEAEVAAAFGPLVVLFGKDGADEPDDGGPVGEDADDVGAATDLPVEAFGGVVGPDLAPDLLRDAVKTSTSARAVSR